MDNIEKAYKNLMKSLFDEKTQKGKQKVFIINGAPGSGKTSYVRENHNQGDLILDMDLLVSALLGEPLTAHPDYHTVIDTAIEARELIYRSIEKRVGEWKQAFVITSSPNKRSVQELAQRLDGEIVILDTSKEECIKRIKEDRSRNTTRDINLVEHWFNH